MEIYFQVWDGQWIDIIAHSVEEYKDAMKLDKSPPKTKKSPKKYID